MSKIKFAHVALTCNNIDTIVEFYCKHLGFMVTRNIPLGEDSKIVFLKNHEDIYLELFETEEPRPVPKVETGDGPHYSGLRHLAFQVDDVDAKLREMGDEAVITLGPLALDDFIPGWKVVWIKDPEGNIIEISQGYRD